MNFLLTYTVAREFAEYDGSFTFSVQVEAPTEKDAEAALYAMAPVTGRILNMEVSEAVQP